MQFHKALKIASLGLLFSTAALAVPDTFLYVGDLAEDGAPADGNFSVTFQMFNDDTAGTVVFAETVASLVVVDGALVHELGTAPNNALDDAELAAGELYLSVIVNGTTLEPRVPIRSVPFASKAGDAESVGGRAIGDLVETADLAAGAGLSLAGSTFSVAPGGIALENMGGAIAAVQTNGVNSGGRILVVRKPNLCSEGIDVVEDTGLGTDLFYNCRMEPCAVNGTGQFLFRTLCNVQTACTSLTAPTCSALVRLAGDTTGLSRSGTFNGVIGQLVAIEER